MIREPSARDLVVEAIAWWRLRLPGARRRVVESASVALRSGWRGEAAAQLAGERRSDRRTLRGLLTGSRRRRADPRIDRLVARLVDEHGLEEDLGGNLGLIALRPLCRDLASGRIEPRALTSWAHAHFVHGDGSESIEELLILDDEFDLEGADDVDVDACERSVREIAERILRAEAT